MRRMAFMAGMMLATLIAFASPPTRINAQAQAGTIRITAPANGSTVPSPAAVTVDIQNVTVKPAAEGDASAFHYHVLVDVDPATVVQAGQPIPTGQANIIHTADRTVPLPNLTPGAHTITVILTKTDHIPLSPVVQDRVQFTVAAAGQPQATPAPTAAAGATATPAATARPATATPAATPPATAPRVGTGTAGDGRPSPAWWLIPAAIVLTGTGLAATRRRTSRR